MKYEDGTYDPVTAAELAHDREQAKQPFWRCQRCPEVLYEEDASAQNWLVCKGCGRALCEECVIFIAETADEAQRYGPAAHTYRDGDERFTRLESVHNLGFCSTGCLAAKYESDGWEWRRGQLRADADAAQNDYDRAIDVGLCREDLPGRWALAASRLKVLIDQVRAVCNLERQ